MNLDDKILGSILGAAVGDAMGAATELRTTWQIKEKFGGYVKEFIAPPKDTFGRGRKPGQVTDDFSVAYYILQALIKYNGVCSEQAIHEAFINWSNDDEYYIPFAGPTTRRSIDRMKGMDVASLDDEMCNYNGQATNGSAMRIFPIGILNYKDMDKVIEDTITTTIPTHFNNLAISGACAISAAVAKAMEGKSTLEDIFTAGIKGAQLGDEKGRALGHIAAGASVSKRIEWAVQLGLESKDFDKLLININDYIGTGIHITESVPAVFGLIAGVGGNTMEGIYAGVNVGSDTDTIATMIGAILGAFNGIQSIPKGYLDIINDANSMQLDKTAAEFKIIVGD